MAPFVLKFKGNRSFVAFQSMADADALAKTWKVCTKVAAHLEQGQRLENLSWRLWHLHNLMVESDDSRSKREFKKLSKVMGDKLDKEKNKSIEELPAPGFKPTVGHEKLRQRAEEKERTRTAPRMHYTFALDTPKPEVAPAPAPAPIKRAEPEQQQQQPAVRFLPFLEGISPFAPTAMLYPRPTFELALDELLADDPQPAAQPMDLSQIMHDEPPQLTVDTAALIAVPPSQTSASTPTPTPTPSMPTVTPPQSATAGGPAGKTECSNCGATHTPLWRRGLNDELNCNACGLYCKLHKRPRPKNFRNATDGSRPAWSPRDEGPEPVSCYNCHTTATPLWRKDEDGKTVCNACGLYSKLHGQARPASMKSEVIRKRSRHESKPRRRRSRAEEVPLPGSPEPRADDGEGYGVLDADGALLDMDYEHKASGSGTVPYFPGPYHPDVLSQYDYPDVGSMFPEYSTTNASDYSPSSAEYGPAPPGPDFSMDEPTSPHKRRRLSEELLGWRNNMIAPVQQQQQQHAQQQSTEEMWWPQQHNQQQQQWEWQWQQQAGPGEDDFARYGPGF